MNCWYFAPAFGKNFTRVRLCPFPAGVRIWSVAEHPSRLSCRRRSDQSCSNGSGRGRVATVRVQDLGGHVARILAGEEQEGRRDLVRLARATHWRILAEVLHLLRLLSTERIERRPDRPRRDCVHADALLDQVQRERACER